MTQRDCTREKREEQLLGGRRDLGKGGKRGRSVMAERSGATEGKGYVFVQKCGGGSLHRAWSDSNRRITYHKQARIG